MVIKFGSKTHCGNTKCVRCVADNKCRVQRKIVQNAIENEVTKFDIKGAEAYSFLRKRNSGRKPTWP
jgi:hypothetical protein